MNVRRCFSWWIVVFNMIYLHGNAQDPTVVLPQGRVVGTRVFTKNSPVPIEAFFGIPYAMSPVGRHRFAAPERHPVWRRTLYAHRLPARCPQRETHSDRYFSEDCLFLNICTPRRVETNPLPVVVLMYSESWSQSGTLALPCQDLAAEGLVVVSLAYRLHILGFFTLRSRVARGNLALLDQYMAFLWIRENIAAFGGDPTAVTLLGHSAGADSILYHMSSPRAAGLFKRVVVMSPRDIWSAVSVSKIETIPEVERISREAARLLGCVTNSDEVLVQCLQTRSLDQIMEVFSKGNWSKYLHPVVDDFLPESEQYLPQQMATALSSADISKISQLEVLFGTTDLNSINSEDVDYDDLASGNSASILDYATRQAIPQLLKLHDLHRSPALSALVEAVLWEYWGPRSVRTQQSSWRQAERLARARSAGAGGAGAALLAARLARRVARLYVYRYMQPGFVDLLGNNINYTGAVHGADLIALLGDGMLEQLARRRANMFEQHSSTYLRKYIVNFIKLGYPDQNNEWPQYQAGAAYLHDLQDNDNNTSHTASREVAFWLQYLPQLANILHSSERTEPLNSVIEDTRLRGAVYALVGVAVFLLLLLCVCAVLLRRES